MSDTLTLTSIAKQLPTVLADIVKLQNPVLDATILAEIVSLASPFGINVGPAGPIIVGSLVLIGTVASMVEKAIAALKPPAAK